MVAIEGVDGGSVPRSTEMRWRTRCSRRAGATAGQSVPTRSPSRRTASGWSTSPRAQPLQRHLLQPVAELGQDEPGPPPSPIAELAQPLGQHRLGRLRTLEHLDPVLLIQPQMAAQHQLHEDGAPDDDAAVLPPGPCPPCSSPPSARPRRSAWGQPTPAPGRELAQQRPGHAGVPRGEDRAAVVPGRRSADHIGHRGESAVARERETAARGEVRPPPGRAPSAPGVRR